jgi:uncharacterized protein (TIGR02678 family)
MTTAYAAARGAFDEDAQARLTFLRLLCRPLVTAALDRNLYRDVLRYSKHIDEYCKRLEYRRSHLGGAIRLVRTPILGTVIAPPRPMDFPPRRVLTLTALLAAACEEVEGGVTLVKLSDLVDELCTSTDRAFRAYDPNQLTERRHLVKAAELLEFWGVLRKRTSLVADVTGWTETRTGIGAGYDVDREALLLFVNPDTIALAATHRARLEAEAATSGSGEADDSWQAQRQATRVVRQLRTLVETPGLLYADLPADERDLARTQRGLRADAVLGLIGGGIEARCEGLVWISHEDDCPATVAWPTPRTESWAALMAADKAGRDGHRADDGTVHLEHTLVDDILTDLTEWKGDYFRQDLREDPKALRQAIEDTLTSLGLLRVGSDWSWRLSPLAGRYRDPDLIEPDTPPADLFTTDEEPATSTEPADPTPENTEDLS